MSKTINPPWINEAKKYEGLKEVPGAGNNPTIVNWLVRIKAWWRDDLTPWCGTYLGGVFLAVGLAIPKAAYRAMAWLEWGRKLESPAYGCVVIFDRKGGGHVGFVVGRDARGRLLVLGGNQKDAVRVDPFEMDRVKGYRWPLGSSLAPDYNLPTVYTSAASSTVEA